MDRATVRIPITHLNFLSSNLDFELTAGQAAGLSDMAFGFLEDGEGWPPESFSSTDGSSENGALDDDDDEDDDKEKKSSSEEDKKNFWESQHQTLHVNSFFFLFYMF